MDMGDRSALLEHTDDRCPNRTICRTPTENEEPIPLSEHFDIRVADMSSKRRPREIAVPRQIAMYLCRRMTRASFPDIANSFSKTHATVLHACKVVEGRMDVDSDLRGDITEISHRLGHPIV